MTGLFIFQKEKNCEYISLNPYSQKVFPLVDMIADG
jgi:hypothetical protein